MIYKTNYNEQEDFQADVKNPFADSNAPKQKSGVVKPVPVDREVVWDKTKTLISKTDKFGNIEYANDAFIEVSSYEDFELMSQPHSIIRHPDMPRVIFKILWDNLKAKKNFHAIIKNMAKTGRYYWVITNFEIKKDEADNIIGYVGYRKSVAESVIREHIEPLYKRLLKIEEVNGLDASEKYFLGYLEEKETSYYQFIANLLKQAEEAETASVETEEVPEEGDAKDVKATTKGFFARFFS
ncbi:histidine kinase [Capnocytophaga canimorsus]|uniref:Histidine kinase n=1 Tax=Capnocytophaga canimorsus TaxID=28188 RepID=A0A250G2J5_9FLAO|nr:PAS domain-containing protein [Capnocytophaga canimorsus]ATA91523.1 histidine kinase [Capnocytophaga canimorsus]